MKRLRTFFIICFTVSQIGSAIDVATAVSPENTRTPKLAYCDNAYKLLSPGDSRKIQIEDNQTRELFIMQALGHDGLLAIEQAVHRPPFEKIQTEQEALALVDKLIDDPQAYGPVNHVLNRLSNAQSWALYLNSGFHAVSTHTDGHRDMVLGAVEHFPTVGTDGGPARVIDMGIGNGNLVIAAGINNPRGIVYGVDIAGSGLNISTWRMNQITDLASQKLEDPGLENTGRFWMGRGNAADPQLLKGMQFDGASMVLTLFAVPTAQRRQALVNLYNSLKPGAKFILIDPIPKVGGAPEGRQFLKEIVKSAYKNNVDLTALDIAILTAKNAHNLLQIDFMEPEQQKQFVESVGFRAVTQPVPAYYGITSMTVFEKPF